MIERIEFCAAHNPLIKYPYTTLEFAPGYNVVTGPSGSGKTLLLNAIRSCKECTVVSPPDLRGMIYHFSTEYYDIRTVVGRSKAIESLKHLSHGEGTALLFGGPLKALAVKPKDTLLIDEPEAGMDLASCLEVAGSLNWLADKGIQVILGTHHPAFIPNAMENTDRVHVFGDMVTDPEQALKDYITEWEAAVEALQEWLDEQTNPEEEEEPEEKHAENPVVNATDSA